MAHDQSDDFTPDQKPDGAIRPAAAVSPEAVLQDICGVRVTEADLEKARDLWRETRTDSDPDFDALPQAQRAFGALLSRIMRDDEQATIKCPACLDRGLTLHPREVNGYSRPVTFARFCEGTARTACEAGTGAEAGYWFRMLKPEKHAQTKADDRARWVERQRIHLHGLALRDRVERLLGTAESAGDAP